MITKGPLRKQVIIHIRLNNAKRVMAKANTYISNINRFLKRVKSEISVNFICSDNKGLLITTNKVAVTSDSNIIKKYIKNFNDINSSNIISLRLP